MNYTLNKIKTVLAIIEETRGFASLSHGVRTNLEEAQGLLEEIEASVADHSAPSPKNNPTQVATEEGRT